MKKVAKLESKEQASSLEGQIVCKSLGLYFNPIQDADGNYIISVLEKESCSNKDSQWVKDLKEIDFNPKKYVLDGGD